MSITLRYYMRNYSNCPAILPETSNTVAQPTSFVCKNRSNTQVHLVHFAHEQPSDANM